MIERITIPKDTYLELERLRYEYNATLNVFTYLLKQNDIIQEDIFEQVLIRCERRQIALSIYEETISTNLRPSVDYVFDHIDYDTEEVVYKIEKMGEDI